jgi:hypothetical protein
VTFHCKSGRGIPLGNIEVPYASPRGNQTSRTSEGYPKWIPLGIRFRSYFCSRTHRFRDIGWGKFFLTMENPISKLWGSSPPPINDVTTTAYVRCSPPVKVIRRNGRLFDQPIVVSYRYARATETQFTDKKKKQKKQNKNIRTYPAEMAGDTLRSLCAVARWTCTLLGRKFVGGGRRKVWPPWPDSRRQTFRAPYIRCGTTEVSNMEYKNFGVPGVSENVIFLTILPITPLSDPFLGYFDLNAGRPKGYLLIKFGRNRLVNENFRAPGVQASVIFPTFPLITPSFDPFFWHIDYREVGRPNRYLHVKFGRNRLVNKNFTARGCQKT